MTHKYDTYEKYYSEVKAMAKRYYDYAEEGAPEIRSRAFNPDEIPDEVPQWAIVEAAMENHKLLQYYRSSVVYHCQEGFYGEGGQRFFNDPKDQSEALSQMARAGLYNDVLKKVRHIEKTREDLGDALKLIEGPMYDKGMMLYYDYHQHLSSDDSQTYTLEKVAKLGNEWRVVDPDGVSFEVISPDVVVENRDQYIPEYALKLFLDNVCARRDNQMDSSE